MYCGKCGNKIDDKSNFCLKCGLNTSNKAKQKNNKNIQPQIKEKSNKSIIGIIIPLIIIIAIVISASILVLKDSNINLFSLENNPDNNDVATSDKENINPQLTKEDRLIGKWILAGSNSAAQVRIELEIFRGGSAIYYGESIRWQVNGDTLYLDDSVHTYDFSNNYNTLILTRSDGLQTWYWIRE